jgi:hypothetical protein
VEGVVIVGSILLAFGIEAWWEGVQERTQEREIIERLISDGQADIQGIEGGLNAHDLTLTASVVSSEPDDANGNGDGKTTGDIRVTTGAGVLLSSNAEPIVTFDPESDRLEVRSERAGTGPGRTYTIKVTATDDEGNESEETVTVTVPHDKS